MNNLQQERRERLQSSRWLTAEKIQEAQELHEMGEISQQELAKAQEQYIHNFACELSDFLAQERDIEPNMLIDPVVAWLYGACCAYMDYRFDDSENTIGDP